MSDASKENWFSRQWNSIPSGVKWATGLIGGGLLLTTLFGSDEKKQEPPSILWSIITSPIVIGVTMLVGAIWLSQLFSAKSKPAGAMQEASGRTDSAPDRTAGNDTAPPALNRNQYAEAKEAFATCQSDIQACSADDKQLANAWTALPPGEKAKVPTPG